MVFHGSAPDERTKPQTVLGGEDPSLSQSPSDLTPVSALDDVADLEAFARSRVGPQSISRHGGLGPRRNPSRAGQRDVGDLAQGSRLGRSGLHLRVRRRESSDGGESLRGYPPWWLGQHKRQGLH